MLKNEKSANSNDHQNRKTEVFCNKNRKTDLKNSQNRKTENPNAPLFRRSYQIMGFKRKRFLISCLFYVLDAAYRIALQALGISR